MEFLTCVQFIGYTFYYDNSPVKYELGKIFQKRRWKCESFRASGATAYEQITCLVRVEAKKSTKI